MLVLSRVKGQSIIVDGKIKIKVFDVRGGRVRLVFDAPDNVEIWREEVFIEIEKAKHVKEG
jgi:carbon storage regulator